MQNGKFTWEERDYLLSLPAVREVRSRFIIYSDEFKKETMKRYYAGEKPGLIFKDAGLPASLIGYKRIERSIARWKESLNKDCLTLYDAPVISHKNQITTIKSKHKAEIKKQRKIREKQVNELKDKMAKQKQRYKDRRDRTIEAQAAEIKKLKSQVKALKALGTFARKTKRAPKTTNKNDRFQIIEMLSESTPGFCIKAACDILEVSRSGYYAYLQAAESRNKREEQDKLDSKLIEEVFNYKNFKKGSRQVKLLLESKHNCVMNRKKIIRLMSKYGYVFKAKRKKPYYPIDIDGEPKLFPNMVNRQFKTGVKYKVLLTDITYLKYTDGFAYLSGIKDAETCEIIAYEVSNSLKMPLVLNTLKQLESIKTADKAIIHSDMGCHYTSKSYRAAVKKANLIQSMSRKGNCWDNAPMESFFGKMKDQLPDFSEYTLDELKILIDDYIDYYNNERPQEGLN